jgi:hypothetical protein
MALINVFSCDFSPNPYLIFPTISSKNFTSNNYFDFSMTNSNASSLSTSYVNLPKYTCS